MRVGCRENSREAGTSQLSAFELKSASTKMFEGARNFTIESFERKLAGSTIYVGTKFGTIALHWEASGSLDYFRSEQV